MGEPGLGQVVAWPAAERKTVRKRKTGRPGQGLGGQGPSMWWKGKNNVCLSSLVADVLTGLDGGHSRSN